MRRCPAICRRGVAPVELERITFDEIRAGTWRHVTAMMAVKMRFISSGRRRRSSGPARPVGPVPLSPRSPSWAPGAAPHALEPCRQRRPPAETQCRVFINGHGDSSPLPPVPNTAAQRRGFWSSLAPSIAGVPDSSCAPGRRRLRLAGAAARDLRRHGVLSRPGRPLCEPRGGAGHGSTRPRSARPGADDCRAALIAAAVRYSNGKLLFIFVVGVALSALGAPDHRCRRHRAAVVRGGADESRRRAIGTSRPGVAAPAPVVAAMPGPVAATPATLAVDELHAGCRSPGLLALVALARLGSVKITGCSCS